MAMEEILRLVSRARRGRREGQLAVIRAVRRGLPQHRLWEASDIARVVRFFARDAVTDAVVGDMLRVARRRMDAFNAKDTASLMGAAVSLHRAFPEEIARMLPEVTRHAGSPSVSRDYDAFSLTHTIASAVKLSLATAEPRFVRGLLRRYEGDPDVSATAARHDILAATMLHSLGKMHVGSLPVRQVGVHRYHTPPSVGGGGGGDGHVGCGDRSDGVPSADGRDPRGTKGWSDDDVDDDDDDDDDDSGSISDLVPRIAWQLTSDIQLHAKGLLNWDHAAGLALAWARLAIHEPDVWVKLAARLPLDGQNEAHTVQHLVNVVHSFASAEHAALSVLRAVDKRIANKKMGDLVADPVRLPTLLSAYAKLAYHPKRVASKVYLKCLTKPELGWTARATLRHICDALRSGVALGILHEQQHVDSFMAMITGEALPPTQPVGGGPVVSLASATSAAATSEAAAPDTPRPHDPRAGKRGKARRAMLCGEDEEKRVQDGFADDSTEPREGRPMSAGGQAATTTAPPDESRAVDQRRALFPGGLDAKDKAPAGGVEVAEPAASHGVGSPTTTASTVGCDADAAAAWRALFRGGGASEVEGVGGELVGAFAGGTPAGHGAPSRTADLGLPDWEGMGALSVAAGDGGKRMDEPCAEDPEDVGVSQPDREGAGEWDGALRGAGTAGYDPAATGIEVLSTTRGGDDRTGRSRGAQEGGGAAAAPLSSRLAALAGGARRGRDAWTPTSRLAAAVRGGAPQGTATTPLRHPSVDPHTARDGGAVSPSGPSPRDATEGGPAGPTTLFHDIAQFQSWEGGIAMPGLDELLVGALRDLRARGRKQRLAARERQRAEKFDPLGSLVVWGGGKLPKTNAAADDVDTDPGAPAPSPPRQIRNTGRFSDNDLDAMLPRVVSAFAQCEPPLCIDAVLAHLLPRMVVYVTRAAEGGAAAGAGGHDRSSMKGVTAMTHVLAQRRWAPKELTAALTAYYTRVLADADAAAAASDPRVRRNRTFANRTLGARAVAAREIADRFFEDAYGGDDGDDDHGGGTDHWRDRDGWDIGTRYPSLTLKDAKHMFYAAHAFGMRGMAVTCEEVLLHRWRAVSDTRSGCAPETLRGVMCDCNELRVYPPRLFQMLATQLHRGLWRGAGAADPTGATLAAVVNAFAKQSTFHEIAQLVHTTPTTPALADAIHQSVTGARAVAPRAPWLSGDGPVTGPR